MGAFDQAARFAARADPDAVTRRALVGTTAALRFQDWADTRTLSKPGDSDRTVDLVAWLEDPAAPDHPWLLVFEFQARHDPEKLDVTLEEVARLRLHARHGRDRRGKFCVLTGLIYLRGQCPDSALNMTLPEGFGTRHIPLIWNVENDGADATLTGVASGRVSWGMLFWVPLMAGGGDATVLVRWKELAATVESGRRRGDLGKMALVFAELVGRGAAWQQSLEGFDMTESQVVNGWIKEAIDQNRLEEGREYLVRVLRRRFPAVLTEDVLKAINAQPSLDLLHDWFEVALSAFTAEEFLAALRR
ncbi:hypothetical protein [Fimbriiglobus ruber]|uniref:Uncharacterized protein n=1 Tax=Fimbriiglobus ruber TaxID=1908690 RepID=A0A225DFW7_9BACT|nr:hypothetical protein [Fimbriiglobus ruber]OWK40440.1 hypothetical protein FRUB_05359 [Fimbriiglobus ruber]